MTETELDLQSQIDEIDARLIELQNSVSYLEMLDGAIAHFERTSATMKALAKKLEK